MSSSIWVRKATGKAICALCHKPITVGTQINFKAGDGSCVVHSEVQDCCTERSGLGKIGPEKRERLEEQFIKAEIEECLNDREEIVELASFFIQEQTDDWLEGWAKAREE